MTDLTSRLIVGLVDRLTGPSRAISSALGRLNAAATANAARMNAVRGQMLDAVGAGYILAQSLSAPVKAAIDFESSMSDLTKVMDFSSPAAFKDMTKDIREMSLRIPIAASGIADIAAAAAGAGIKENELTKFTELAAKVSTAWDTTAGETGKDLAKLKSGLGLTLEETGLLADAINHLSNNSSAAAPEILKVVKSTATTAKQFGFTAEQTAAFGTAMVSSGFEADVAATSFLNAGRALTKGASATPRVSAAFKKLGLSAKGTAKSMQKDAMGTFVDVLQRINKLPAEMRASTVSDLFGDEARALGPLITNGQMLADVLGLISDKNKYAGSASKEFDAAAKRTANSLKLFKNRVTDLAISVGDALLPGLNKILEVIGPTITNISRLAQEYPGLTAAITAATTAVIAFRIALTALKFAGLFAWGGMLSGAIAGLGGTSAILTSVSGGLSALGAAAAAVSAPVLLAIGVGLAAIGAAGAYLWAKWDRISSIVSGVASAIGDELKPVIDLLQPVLQPFAESFTALGDAAKWCWEQMKEAASWVGSFFEQENLTRQHQMTLEDGAYETTRKLIAAFKAGGAALAAAGGELMQSLWDGAKAKFWEMIEWVKNIPSEIRAAIGRIDLSDVISWPSPPAWLSKLWGGGGGASTEGAAETPAIDGARAKGGPVKAGGTYLVGEDGPELFNPGRSGVINTNDAYNAAAAGSAAARSGPVKAGGNTVTISPTISPTINIHGGNVGTDPQAFARDMSDKVGAYLISQLEGACGFQLEDGTYT